MPGTARLSAQEFLDVGQLDEYSVERRIKNLYNVPSRPEVDDPRDFAAPEHLRVIDLYAALADEFDKPRAGLARIGVDHDRAEPRSPAIVLIPANVSQSYIQTAKRRAGVGLRTFRPELLRVNDAAQLQVAEAGVERVGAVGTADAFQERAMKLALERRECNHVVLVRRSGP